ncbi:hypothetical protein IX296_001993 [Bacteroides pyogenes]|nr:hypothetical protein [Bacteroides pyogenes]MBR8754824.1 hypothetical protein [Bacteroides pyogenes]MBR8809699.1 hypothetical protein [Bacteroides pyogenes]
MNVWAPYRLEGGGTPYIDSRIRLMHKKCMVTNLHIAHFKFILYL